MIQLLPSRTPHAARRTRASWALLLVVFAASACAHHDAGPRHAQSATRKPTRSVRFVPPFAYEAYIRGELDLASGKPEQAARQFELATAAPFGV